MSAFSAFSSDFRKLTPTRQILLGLIMLFALISGIGASYYFSLSNPPTQALVYLKTSQKSPHKGDIVPITLSLDSKNTGIEAADFVVTFDPSFLSFQTLEKGSFFQTYPRTEIGENRLYISAIATLKDDTVILPKGKGDVATILFVANKSGVTDITIDQKETTVAVSGRNIATYSPASIIKLSIL
ncbi:hypothetical protein HYW55_00005 [Candidatus Gottesmanbacteria bacterium]|nr:hypothetical protein [Candidatus Gottesmanbacteria bacterium]